MCVANAKKSAPDDGNKVFHMPLATRKTERCRMTKSIQMAQGFVQFVSKLMSMKIFTSFEILEYLYSAVRL